MAIQLRTCFVLMYELPHPSLRLGNEVLEARDKYGTSFEIFTQIRGSRWTCEAPLGLYWISAGSQR
jgi:hypothetical protein